MSDAGQQHLTSVANRGLVSRVVIGPGRAWLLRRRQERERVLERHVIGVDVVARGYPAVGYQEEERINDVVNRTPAVWETGPGVVATSRT